jgi:hypothetical protein
LHTSFVPQVVPSFTLVSASAQTGAPVSHCVTPRWQAFAGGQLEPDAHAMHAPAELHTMSVPHDVPGWRGWLVSEHTADPVLQSMVPW